MKAIQDLLYDNPSFKSAVEAFRQDGKTNIYGLSGSQKTFLWAQALKEAEEEAIIVLVHNREEADRWERDLAFLAPHKVVRRFPQVDHVQFSTAARSLENQANQMSALADRIWGHPSVVIATAEEVAQYIAAPDQLKACVLHINLGEELNRDTLLEELVSNGYERVDQVEQRGHFAVRGDIIDIFPVNEDKPVRIELFGDQVDTIRHFDEVSQRSIDSLDTFNVAPFSMISSDNLATLLSYGKDALLIIDEPLRVQEALKKYLKEDPDHLKTHADWPALTRTMVAKRQIAYTFMQQRSMGLPGFSSIGIQGKSMTSFERQVPIFIEEVKNWHKLGHQVVLVMNNRQRKESLLAALAEGGIRYEEVDHWGLKKNVVLVMQGLLTDGFELPHSHFILVTEGNIYGTQKKRLRRKQEKGQEINYFTDLTVGDYVVHALHGIGKYLGLKTIEVEGKHKDYIEIAYAGTDRLFLPADHLDQLQKYIGNEGDVPRIHKMGGADWRKVKAKAQKSIDDLADKLVELYAKREIAEGFAFPEDTPWQAEFEDAFPYEETADQLVATAEIKESMERQQPMDRLLCGDVGFGKTEVAMRAIFKAVMAGKQVAVLVPTTVLAQQHFQTFSDRFSHWGLHVDVLNRFRSAAEKKETLKKTAEGQVDVLIGTHSLLNAKVKFKDLGLLVVDEEQRFGVAQKEKWKEWANTIDVLTLSATPIPRTLHMSLVGVREMSVISTPPEDRLPVQTYVVEYDMGIITDAIRRELQRGGQVFFVYNRVASIGHMEEVLTQAMPDLRVAIAHGQMTGRQIENIMTDFYEGHYDVLLSTSIIETGLDIPNANTIIIYDADRLGLSQLYQMRGRVGRSRRRAYAYFMYRPDKLLTEQAEKRLKAIEEFTELGAGFKLAMRDLEIRGAGNLLGSQQHGNIAAVGFGTYVAMLEEAVAKAQHKEVEVVPPDPAVDLEVDAFIDDAYIKDSARKISIYQRLLKVKSLGELNDLTDELVDRFGTPTDPVERLLRVAKIKEEARLLGIKSILFRNDTITIQWQDESKMVGWDLGSIDQALWKSMKILGGQGQAGQPLMVYIYTKSLGADILTIIDRVMKNLALRDTD